MRHYILVKRYKILLILNKWNCLEMDLGSIHLPAHPERGNINNNNKRNLWVKIPGLYYI